MKQTNHPNNLSDFFDPYEDELTLDEAIYNANFVLYQKDLKMWYYAKVGRHLHEMLTDEDTGPYAEYFIMKEGLLNTIDSVLSVLEEHDEYELCGKLFKKRKQYVKELDKLQAAIDRHTGINEWDID